jgi:hypothetical protein
VEGGRKGERKEEGEERRGRGEEGEEGCTGELVFWSEVGCDGVNPFCTMAAAGLVGTKGVTISGFAGAAVSCFGVGERGRGGGAVVLAVSVVRGDVGGREGVVTVVGGVAGVVVGGVVGVVAGGVVAGCDLGVSDGGEVVGCAAVAPEDAGILIAEGVLRGTFDPRGVVAESSVDAGAGVAGCVAGGCVAGGCVAVAGVFPAVGRGRPGGVVPVPRGDIIGFDPPGVLVAFAPL